MNYIASLKGGTNSMWYGFGWGFPWFLFWVLVIFLCWGGFRRRGRWYHETDLSVEKTAEEILADRFAKGEINEEEYEKRLSVLKKHSK